MRGNWAVLERGKSLRGQARVKEKLATPEGNFILVAIKAYGNPR